VTMPLSVAYAEQDTMDHEHPVMESSGPLILGEDINLNPNEALLEVHGIVCSFCSYGIQKKLSKLPFVDTDKYKKGSHVSIEDQQITIAIREGHVFDLMAVFDAIKSGGYEPVQAFVADEAGNITNFGAPEELEEEKSEPEEEE